MTPDTETPLDFTEENRSLWPALRILKRDRDEGVARLLSELILHSFQAHRLMADEDVSPDLLASPTSTADVTAWLHRIWQRLTAAEASNLLETKRSIMEEIAGSALGTKQQADLFTALDYLCRLASARIVASTVRATSSPTIPSIRSHAMQAVYRRLVKLAATDLPIWLSGETGVELEEIARLIHRLRDLQENCFHLLESDGTDWSEIMIQWSRFMDGMGIGSEITVVVRDLERAPKRFQRGLYDYLVKDLRRNGTIRLVLITGPLDLTADIHSEVVAELFAFLHPMKVEIPPLRARTDDLECLIAFHVQSRAMMKDPVDRFTPEALEALRSYHWPGNTEELEMAVAYILHKKPVGAIGLQHLPETVVPPVEQAVEELANLLHRSGQASGFRVLKSRDGCLKLARYLCRIGDETFTASDVQGLFHLGRETARRLLGFLQSEQLVEGIKGARSQRTTRFRSLCSGVCWNSGTGVGK